MATKRQTMPTPVPNRPTARTRGIRVTDELWDKAKAHAHERGEYLADVINESLERYVAKAEKEAKAKAQRDQAND
ncbi:hypothetical protein CLV30_1288 [Haloactinopolyspora alba]|uniref:Uncharacterized protein n=1 Tax=Haloactinopolyspora alba TaxID=648780 RepID=A0A2P8DEV3_9ACTN|nr:hypothetical protein [Haloactinopolyspora alba]PSK95756.1 hypothetical protein CLV30_1288 [Haloactinopolyspora alba]